MTPENELSVIRGAYAKHVLAAAGVRDPRLETAYATVRREDFLGEGPWRMVRGLSRYVPTPNADPVYLYNDDLVGILPERQINNGQPSFHAGLMAAAEPKEGEHVVHVGAGTGYYSAILAEMVGRRGQLTAIEYDPELAAQATKNLRPFSNVEVLQGDGAKMSFRDAAVIYLNAGATRPANTWLDRLNDGGRLILPLTTDKVFSQTFDKITSGVVFRIQREGNEYLARWISTVAVFPSAALMKGGEKAITRLYRDDPPPPERCWLQAPGWSLA